MEDLQMKNDSFVKFPYYARPKEQFNTSISLLE